MSEQLLQRIFKRLRGKPAGEVRRGYGSSITFQFGKPTLTVRKKVFWPTIKSGMRYPRRLTNVEGEWGLWIFCCDWVIRQDGRKVGDSTSKERIDRGCAILKGQRLMKLAVRPSNLRTDFHFDLGGHLQTTPCEGQPMEMWLLSCQNRKWFVLRADGRFNYQPGNTPPDRLAWRPLATPPSS